MEGVIQHPFLRSMLSAWPATTWHSSILRVGTCCGYNLVSLRRTKESIAVLAFATRLLGFSTTVRKLL